MRRSLSLLSASVSSSSSLSSSLSLLANNTTEARNINHFLSRTNLRTSSLRSNSSNNIQVKRSISHGITAASHQQPQGLLRLSHREKADLESRLISRVGATVQDSILNQSLSSLGWLSPRLEILKEDKSGGVPVVELSLTLPSLLHPDLTRLQNDIQVVAEHELAMWFNERAASSVPKSSSLSSAAPWQVQVTTRATAVSPPVPLMARLAEDPSELLQLLGPGLANVAHFVAVYSCKGGVGKSTVAVNLAYQLARAGGRIGLLVRDIYIFICMTCMHLEGIICHQTYCCC
jgi:hypothetical protein